MPTPDQARILADRARPRITELWWALRPLKSVVRLMQSGAHPDDETSDMLAALAFRDGINLSYACSTRGEGGQNDIGTETGADLGALRTREMERACDILNMRMYWLSENPEDPITDFGFSKSGTDTLTRWGRERTLARLVEILRTDRPDILMPTFLDVPGQHGHHRAMTEMAHTAMKAAADPGFPSNLPPWTVAKLYLPAWSGAGQSYDDDEPPPPATLTISGAGRDPVTGWNWGRIGQQSRVFHRTQGMGRWVPPGTHRDWPLHLVLSRVQGPDTDLTSGLPRGVADLAALPGAGPIADDLQAAGAAIDTAIAAFPDFTAVAKAAAAALAAVRRARAACPDTAREALAHRLDAKEVQLGHVLRHALGVEAHARVADHFLAPGDSTTLSVELGPGAADHAGTALELPHGCQAADGQLTLAPDAAPTNPYRATYDPAAPEAPALLLSLRTGDQSATVRLPFEAAPVVLPRPTARIVPEAVLVNLARPPVPIQLRLTDVAEGSEPRLHLPDGWKAEDTGGGWRLVPPANLGEGLWEMPVLVGGEHAHSLRRIEHAHVAPTARAHPAVLRLRALKVDLPEVRIGYIGAGNDRVGHWLGAMGADVTELSDADIASDAVLAGFDTLVIGIFAMRFRPALAVAAKRLRRWVEDGGTLVTLYHRPWDNWDPDTTPPRRLEIGQPSLRWRVTDETAQVRQLSEHPVLTTPNRIGGQDWDGWVKERGLYFASSWDDAYAPLLEMADPGESPHRGALLVGDIGRGRHVHCALILHHQMEHLVPGAFRLMANLVARRAPARRRTV